MRQKIPFLILTAFFLYAIMEIETKGGLTMKNKITRFLVLKIIGAVCLSVFVAGLIMYIISIGTHEIGSGIFIASFIMMTLGLLSGVPCLFFGFLPRLNQARINTMQMMQQQNIKIIKELSAASAQVAANAQATHQVGGEKMYCKHCGVQIDIDSKFCKACGKEV